MHEAKGERQIARLAALKEQLATESEKIVGWDRFNFYDYLPYLREYILDEEKPVSVDDD